MKHLFLLFPLCLLQWNYAQVNMTQLGHLDLVDSHSSEANDIWGYVDGSGNEYAIVGLNDGTSVVDVTDPSNPVEVFFESGMNSIWRDIKTWGNYAYVTTEAQNGLLIIDLSTLPGNSNLTTNYYTGPNGDEWESAHNLYIDENGYCYIFGANRGNGGTIILDVHTDPMNPTEVGIEDSYYTHDGVVRGDTLYQAHISDGFFTLYDISDKANPVFLGQQNSPGNFSHNLWFSDDGNYLYTTDEITDGYIGEYDISDPTNMVETDRIQSSPGMDVIPHNVHFINDYIVTSYYRDGVTIHDVSNKGNMVEVGNYDTSPTFSGDGFNGCWGVYPWLPSGNIIASDIENGLHVLGATYIRGCYLEGLITDLNTSNPIGGATVTIVTSSLTDASNISGNYATGTVTPGTYNIIYSHPAYYSDTVFGVVLSSGVTVTQDVQLDPISTENVGITVLNDPTSSGLDDAFVWLFNDDFSYSNSTNSNGDPVLFGGVVPGTYTLVTGKWGYITQCATILIDNVNTSFSASLLEGYFDDFSLDFGWLSGGSAPDGIWERAEPNGTTSGGAFINPDEDYDADCLDQAYVTGNSSTPGVGDDDVDIAEVTLLSPSMDLTSYTHPLISCKLWWQNTGGSGNPNDSLKIYISDGSQKILVSFLKSNQSSDTWQDFSFHVEDYLTPSASMSVSFETADWQANGGHLVEAGVDYFNVTEDLTFSVNESLGTPTISAYPNPSGGEFTVDLGDAESFSNRYYKLITITGQLIETKNINAQTFKIMMEKPGIYFLYYYENDSPKGIIKLVKN